MKSDKHRRRYLTKTLFNLAHECPTKLYYHNKEEYPSSKTDDEFLAALAEGGFQVGTLAKCYHPEGVEVETLDSEEAIKQTNELLKRDIVTIFEAAIRFEDFFIRIDILRKANNRLDLIEVKSKSYDPNEDSFLTGSGSISSKWDPYLFDVAFQTCILKKAFPKFSTFPYLMLVDKSQRTSVDGLNQKFRLEERDGRTKVVISGDVNPSALGTKILTLVPVYEYVNLILEGSELEHDESSETFDSFFDLIREYSQYYKQDKRWPISIARKCRDCEFKIDPVDLGPGQKCGFRECWTEQLGWKDEDFDKPLIFDIWDFRSTQQCLERGIYFMEDLPMEEFFLKRNEDNELEFKSSRTERQHLQVDKACYTIDGKEDVKTKLFSEMEKWSFPLHFIDFETSMVAIPFNKGQRPYELIAFQFSCLSLHENGRIEHHEWINTISGVFPNIDFLVALKDVLDKDEGTIFRYAAHENTVLRAIYNQLEDAIDSQEETVPADAQALLNWIETITELDGAIGHRNMVDMLKLVRNFYYHPMMRGSNSLKTVLSAIFTTSVFLREKYSKPYNSKNYDNMIWWEADDKSGLPFDPYTLIPPIFEDGDISDGQYLFENDRISEGGAAMIAYAKMQFSEMTEEERNAIIQGLLKYCELDTLAMVMIYEHWNYLKNNYSN